MEGGGARGKEWTERAREEQKQLEGAQKAIITGPWRITRSMLPISQVRKLRSREEQQIQRKPQIPGFPDLRLTMLKDPNHTEVWERGIGGLRA